MDKLESLLEQRKKLDAEIVNEKRMLALSPERQVAELLHKQFCNWNHADGCGWYYFSWESVCAERESWLSKARKLLAVESSVARIREILNAMK